MEINIVKENNNSKLLKYNQRYFILIPLQEIDNTKQFNEYRNINIKKWEDGDDLMTLIEFKDTEFIEEIFEIISTEIETGKNIFAILSELNNLFIKDINNYLKFRGDIGEALFLMNIGGTKTNDNETFDIIYNEEYIEIKTYSPQKKTIEISLQQLEEETIKYAVPLYSDQNGLNIRQMANKIQNTNPEFYEYIISTYSEDTYLSSLKFKNEIPFDVTNQLKGNINLPSNIISAKFKINISKTIK